jgi:Fe-S-cluster-containing hydrogenase component 2
MAKYRLIDRLRIPTYDNEAYVTFGRVSIDRSRCNGCGMCALICPCDVLVMEGEGKARRAAMTRQEPECMSCNDCAAICKRGAVKVVVSYDYGYRFKTLDRGGLVLPRKFPGG